MAIGTEARVQKAYGRYYRIDDQEFASVTTVLSVIAKPALLNWYAKMEREMAVGVAADLYDELAGTAKMSRIGYLTTIENRMGKEKAARKALEKAGDIGGQVHELIEWTLKGAKGKRPVAVEQAELAFMAWEDWAKEVGLKPILVEQVVYSRKHKYAGTLDLLAEIKGVLTVVDWKSSKAIYGEMHLQNAAYRQALREMGHGDAKAGLLVRLPKELEDPLFKTPKPFETVDAKPEDEMFPVFLNALNLWRWAEIGEKEYQAKVEAAKKTQSTDNKARDIETGGEVGSVLASPGVKPEEKPKRRRTKNGVPMAEIPPSPFVEEKKYQATDADVPF